MVLDTITVHPEQPSNKYIINCTARGRTYLDWIEDFKQDADTSSAHVVGFNYRGIGNSTGSIISQEDIVDDIVAQVKHLMGKGAQPKDICLYGLCLGGGFAALAAAKIKEENIQVKVYLSRTFKRFDNVITSLVLPRKHDSLPVYILKCIALPVLVLIVMGYKLYSL